MWTRQMIRYQKILNAFKLDLTRSQQAEMLRDNTIEIYDFFILLNSIESRRKRDLSLEKAQEDLHVLHSMKRYFRLEDLPNTHYEFGSYQRLIDSIEELRQITECVVEYLKLQQGLEESCGGNFRDDIFIHSDREKAFSTLFPDNSNTQGAVNTDHHSDLSDIAALRVDQKGAGENTVGPFNDPIHGPSIAQKNIERLDAYEQSVVNMETSSELNPESFVYPYFIGARVIRYLPNVRDDVRLCIENNHLDFENQLDTIIKNFYTCLDGDYYLYSGLKKDYITGTITVSPDGFLSNLRKMLSADLANNTPNADIIFPYTYLRKRQLEDLIYRSEKCLLHEDYTLDDDIKYLMKHLRDANIDLNVIEKIKTKVTALYMGDIVAQLLNIKTTSKAVQSGILQEPTNTTILSPDNPYLFVQQISRQDDVDARYMVPADMEALRRFSTLAFPLKQQGNQMVAIPGHELSPEEYEKTHLPFRYAATTIPYLFNNQGSAITSTTFLNQNIPFDNVPLDLDMMPQGGNLLPLLGIE